MILELGYLHPGAVVWFRGAGAGVLYVVGDGQCSVDGQYFRKYEQQRSWIFAIQILLVVFFIVSLAWRYLKGR